MRHRVTAQIVADESGQALVESAVFISILFLLVAYALNFNYYIGFVTTLHTAGAKAAYYSAQGDLTALAKTPPTTASVATVAKNEDDNSLRATTEAAPQVSVCMPSSGTDNGCSGFSDPETGVPGTGGFVMNSVTVTQQFTPLFGSGRSIFGHDLVPFTSAIPVSHTVYMRELQ